MGISRYTLISLPDIAFRLGYNGRLSVDSVPPTSAVSIYHLLVSLSLLLLPLLQIGRLLFMPYHGYNYSVAPLSLPICFGCLHPLLAWRLYIYIYICVCVCVCVYIYL